MVAYSLLLTYEIDSFMLILKTDPGNILRSLPTKANMNSCRFHSEFLTHKPYLQDIFLLYLGPLLVMVR